MQTEGRVRASVLDWLSLALVIIGGVNWGLIGLGHFVDEGANWNVVNLIFEDFATVEAIIYLLVGLAALYELYFAYQLYTAGARRDERERGMPED
jgi:uncharacterized membrane protein YuzA (DUF378 family)